MILYPTNQLLSELLKLLVKLKKSNSEKVDFDISGLPIENKIYMVRELPLYCKEAFLKTSQVSEKDKEALKLFRLGLTEQEKKDTDVLTGIILQKESYLKASYSKERLAVVITSFLWKFRNTLDHEMFETLFRNFDMSFVIPKKSIEHLEKHLQGISDKLESGKGIIPFFRIKRTAEYLKDYFKNRHNKQDFVIQISRSSFEKQLREKEDLIDEYIPFYEAVFKIHKDDSLPILSIEQDSVRLALISEEAMKGNIHLDDNGNLTIGRNHIKLKPLTKQTSLLKGILEEPDKRWQYSEFIENFDCNAPSITPSIYEKRAYALQANISKQNSELKDFLDFDGQSIQISKRFL